MVGGGFEKSIKEKGRGKKKEKKRGLYGICQGLMRSGRNEEEGKRLGWEVCFSFFWGKIELYLGEVG